MPHEEHAYETVGSPEQDGPFLLTCEHAGNALHEWQAGAEDQALLADHWGFDVGAADLTRELARRTGSCAVLSRFSRLVCDPNRDPEDPTFVVESIDDQALSFNRGVDDVERARRRARYFDPYHAAIDRALRTRVARPEPVRLCSVHSFTPSYLGRARPMEVGVLFDDHDEIAWRLQQALDLEGFETALNAPYSGYDGMIYAASRHGRAHGIVYLELEVRQDLIATPTLATGVAARLERALRSYAPDGPDSAFEA